MIKQGAKLCEGAEDILSEFEYLFPPTNRQDSPVTTGTLPALALSEPESRVIAALTPGSEHTTDDVIRSTGLPASAASVALFSLELKKLVRQLPGKLYTRVN